MKTFLIIVSLLVVGDIAVAQNHTTRRTLIEEFTSSSNDGSAVSDPVIDQFEGEAPGHFCIVKWYLPYGTKGGQNPFYTDYPLSLDRSHGFYGNDTVSRIYLNGGVHFDPFGLPLDSIRSRVSPEYSKTSPFLMDITNQIVGDSIITFVTVRVLDTTVDLTKLALGVIITERYNQTTDINHIAAHTNIVRTVLPSLQPKDGNIRDALPFAFEMQGQTKHTFRYAAPIGLDWDQYGLVSVGVIQNNQTKEVLQCNWTVPEIQFMRPTASTFLFADGATPCQFQIRNMTDSDITIYPQLTHNIPGAWGLQLQGMPYPSFVLLAHTSATGTFISEKIGPFRGSGDFILVLRAGSQLTVASIAGTLVGSDSRDLIIKHWTTPVYQSDPDIVTWKQFDLDAAICNDDALGDLFNNNLLPFRTVYVHGANYGDSSELQHIRDYMAHGGRMIFNSNTALGYFSNSIVDTTTNKYAVTFKEVMKTIPTGIGVINWTKGNVVKGNVFTDSLPTPFSIGSHPVQPLVPVDTFSKPMIVSQDGSNVGLAIESGFGKIAYLTFPLPDIQNPNDASVITGQILKWFQLPVSKVNSTQQVNTSALVYPNPVTANAIIQYPVSSDSKVLLTLHDELGRLITPVYRSIAEGQLNLDCSSLTSGTYYYSLRTGEKTLRGKMVVSH